ncbi:protein of unknown function DUF928 [Rippkaea orientalis PCC 8801]|uniref:DUF928 domain-containing protein n=1 Tax=Rippkaea orientalis (strain PCC 8801 / RF-1) TaxID=41431 RepID=B7K3V4_RIPO1|nr:DUF928 domain-containing protein [Rippkaea orientalis]ACK66494.1 protein of unknown function DUF928 [Rippkaea orientalis PCC 8801]
MLNHRVLFNLITLGLLLLGTVPATSQSNTNPPPRREGKVTRVVFKPPLEDKKPSQSRAAGSRGKCLDNGNLSLVALVPSSNFGLTTAERPSLWVYVPENSAKQVVLSLAEEDKTYHSRTSIPLAGQSGIIKLQPSPDSRPLEVGKTYQWSAVLVCGDNLSPDDPGVASWVRRVADPKPIPSGSALEAAAFYGEQGIWYDALTDLLKVKQSQPNNPALTTISTEFLQSAGLNLDLSILEKSD